MLRLGMHSHISMRNQYQPEGREPKLQYLSTIDTCITCTDLVIYCSYCIVFIYPVFYN